jgi:tetratricopeptide (TPR) repeat protein
VRQQLEDSYRSLKDVIASQSATQAGRSNAYGDVGSLLLAAEYFEASEPFFLNARQLDSQSAVWPYLLAHAYKRTGRLTSAADLFRESIDRNPRNFAAYVWLGDVSLSLGQVPAAEEAYRHASSMQPDSAAVAAGLGRCALAVGDYARAAQLLERALMLAPDASSLHHAAAMAYRGLGDEAKATAHLERRGTVDANVDDPLIHDVAERLRSPMSYEMRGREALARGDWPAAAAAFRSGIELAGENSTLQSVLHQQLGSALFQMGDGKGALREFEEAVRRSPESAKAQFSLGVLFEVMGRHEEAVEKLSIAVRNDPGDVESRLQLAAALQHTGRIVEADAQFKEAVRLDPRVGKQP